LASAEFRPDTPSRREQTEARETRSTVEIVVRNLTMLDGKKRGNAPPVDDDDIPF